MPDEKSKWLVVYQRKEVRHWIGLWKIDQGGEKVELVRTDEDAPLLIGVTVRWPSGSDDIEWDDGQIETKSRFTIHTGRGLTINTHSDQGAARKEIVDLKKVLMLAEQSAPTLLGLLADEAKVGPPS